MSPQKLNIIHVSSPFSWRGGEQQLFYLYSNLNQVGHNQVVFCPLGSALSKRIAGDHLIEYKKRGGFDIPAAYKLAKQCEFSSWDIIHAHDAHAHTTCVLASTLFGMKVPVVLSRRVDFHVGQSLFSRFKYNHKSVRAIVCVSDAIRRIVEADLGSNPNQIRRTVHSGIDTARFARERKGLLRQELNIGEEITLVGNVAALADHKDYPTFLRTAVHFLNDDSIHFVVFGTGPMEAEIKALCSKLELDDKVSFLGFRENLPELLPDLDIFLFPSKTEGLGTSVLDALGNKISVVATRAGGIPEIIEHGHNGLLADVGNHEELAKHISTIRANKDLRSSFTQNGLQTLKRFSHEETAQRTLAVYKEILNNNSLK